MKFVIEIAMVIIGIVGIFIISLNTVANTEHFFGVAFGALIKYLILTLIGIFVATIIKQIAKRRR